MTRFLFYLAVAAVSVVVIAVVVAAALALGAFVGFVLSPYLGDELAFAVGIFGSLVVFIAAILTIGELT
jgi:hypothetical protein